MSRASAFIRLPDGTMRYALYEGTCDFIWRQTYASMDEAWEQYRNGDVNACGHMLTIQVEYWHAYGDGTWTVMDYCPRCKRLRPKHYDFYEHCDAVGVEVNGSDGADGWVPQPGFHERKQPSWVE